MLNHPLKPTTVFPIDAVPNVITLPTRRVTGRSVPGQLSYLLPYGLIAATTPLLVLANVMARTTVPTQPQPFQAILTAEIHKTLTEGNLATVSSPAPNLAQGNFGIQEHQCQGQ